MHRKHIITLSGKPGSGKSSTADKVAEVLGYARYSSGEAVRALLKEQKMTLREFNKHAEANPAVDHKIDEELRKLRDQEDIVIDSRLGFYWIPESFKVYLDLDDDAAVARIFKDADFNKQRIESGESGVDMTDMMTQVSERMQSERTRFKKLYGINPYHTEHFDLIIDTAEHSPQTVALAVCDTYSKWLASTSWTQVVSKTAIKN